MSQISPAAFSNGYVSARDPYDMLPGEMQRALGMTYRPGDSRAWKQLGRTAFGTVLASNEIKGLALCLFDDGSDKLVAYSGTALYGATPGTTGTFTALATGLSASGETLTAVQQDDRWYLGNGVDRNRVLKSDGTVRLHGLQSPSTAPTVAVGSGAGTTANPTANSGSFTNPTFAYDGDDTTFASATRTSAGSTTHTWTWAANTASSKQLEVRYWLSGLPIQDDSIDRNLGTGGQVDSGFKVTILFEKSENAGVDWTPILEVTRTAPPTGAHVLSSNLGSGSITLHFRATLTYISGINPATLQILTTRTKTGSAATALSAVVRYAVTWVNNNDLNGSEVAQGPPSSYSAAATLVAASGHNQVLVTQPANPEAAATHWRIYRVPDGQAATIANGVLIAEKDISETTFLDDFSLAADFASGAVIPQIALGDIIFPRDSPPPAFAFMWVHRGSVFGLSEAFPRSMRYSESGFPESFPEFYVIPAYNLDEHDRLLCGASLGLTSVIFAEGVVLAVDDPPRVVDGEFDAGQALPIKGHPGCVGRMAMTPYSVAGEARAAWVSPFGVYTTNGSTCERISDDLDWEGEVSEATLGSAVLKWDAKYLRLIFEFDSDGDGVNDREAFIHMGHYKESGQPKWSQPTPKRTSALAHGLIESRYRRYSGHPTDGVVYLEESGGEDAATGEPVAMDIETGEQSTGRMDSACLKVNLLHSDWGEGESGTLTVSAHRGSTGTAQVVTKTVSLEGRRGHEVMVARAGEKFSYRFRHSTDGAGAILGVEPEMERQGRSGSANRWQTV